MWTLSVFSVLKGKLIEGIFLSKYGVYINNKYSWLVKQQWHFVGKVNDLFLKETFKKTKIPNFFKEGKHYWWMRVTVM